MSIKIDVISGFLGAGKTTMINKLLGEKILGERIAIIENEFGDINIDSGRIDETGIEIKSISSGCICCTLAGEFDVAMKSLIDEYNPSRIIIEPTGIGKLSDVIRTVDMLKRYKDVELNIAMAIIDPIEYEDFIDIFGDFFSDQIRNATTIVLSKVQLMDEENINKVIRSIREINTHGNIVAIPWDELSAKQIIDLSESHKNSMEIGELVRDDGHCQHDHEDKNQEKFEFWTLETVKRYDELKLEEILANLNRSDYGIVLRAKGSLLSSQGGWIDFDFMPNQANIVKGKAQTVGQIVVIGMELNREAIKKLFD